MKRRLGLVEQGFTTIALVLFTDGPLRVLLTGGASQGDGSESLGSSSLIQLVFLVIYTAVCCLLIRRWKQSVNLLLQEKFILLLIGLAVASVAWSYAPAITVRRTVALVGTTLFGLYFATRYSIKQQLKLLGWALGIATILSFLFILFLPKYGIMGGPIHPGIWRGIYTHKNNLGKVMVIGVIVFLILSTNFSKHRFVLWCGFSFSTLLLIFSTSKTSLIIGILFLLFFCLYYAVQRRYGITLPLVAALILVSGAFSAQVAAKIYLPIVLSETGSAIVENLPVLSKNENTVSSQPRQEEQSPQKATLENIQTLTGRTKLWPLVLNSIKRRPWLGYGYSGFWQVTQEGKEISQAVGSWASHAHNGLLNVWLDLGIVGVLIFLASFTLTCVRILNQLAKKVTLENVWALSYLAYMVLANLTQTTLLERNNIFWLLYVAVVFSVLLKENDQQSPRMNSYAFSES
ncbi:MAG: O-antigen ligase family protein [Cyanophyceae cyanobacterium]